MRRAIPGGPPEASHAASASGACVSATWLVSSRRGEAAATLHTYPTLFAPAHPLPSRDILVTRFPWLALVATARERLIIWRYGTSQNTAPGRMLPELSAEVCLVACCV